MVSTETPENFSSLSIAKKIPLAFRKAKEAYVLKNATKIYNSTVKEREKELEKICILYHNEDRIANKKNIDSEIIFFLSDPENNRKITGFLFSLSDNKGFRKLGKDHIKDPNSIQKFELLETATVNFLIQRGNITNDQTFQTYANLRANLNIERIKELTLQNRYRELLEEKDLYLAKLENCKISIDNYHKFYRKTVQYTINGVGTFVGATIGCFIGHAIAPKIIKKVTQLSYFKQLTPAKQTKIVKALPWVSRLTGGLLSAGIAFLTTNTLVNWGHRTVLGIV